MNIRNITPNVSVSGQIEADDIEAIRAAGFKAIVCNRPDGEEAGQPEWAELARLAEAAGMATAYQPIAPGAVGEAEALAFREAVTGFDKPVLAFCRTGTRSAQCWALAARDRLSTDEVVRMALTAGYDLEPMRDRLAQGA